MSSSLGFHTVTIYRRIGYSRARKLIEHLCQYREQTGQIRIFQILLRGGNRRTEYREYAPLYCDGVFMFPRNLCIQFCNVDRGIKWKLQEVHERDGGAKYSIAATINPKILASIHDYITAADCDDMIWAAQNYDRITRKISPIFGTFNMYQFSRIDYCLNFDLKELAPECTYEQIMTLIRRSNIPAHYKEWTEYDSTSHRKKSRPGSFYLMCRAAHINIYSKYMKFLEQNEEYVRRGHPPIPSETMERARNIIRFEIQCKYPKVRALYKQANGYNPWSPQESHVLCELLGYPACIAQINHYYKLTIGNGDWYSLNAARKVIKSHKFNQQKEDRLIIALQEVSQCRSVPDAIEMHQDSDLDAFKRTLKDLADIGINPVTIPRDWGIAHIPNLLEPVQNLLIRIAMRAKVRI